MSAPLYAAFDHLTLPVLISEGNRCVYANPALGQLLGVDLDTVRGTEISALISQHVPSPDAPLLQAQHDQRVAGARAPLTTHMRVRDASGLMRALVARGSAGPSDGQWTFVIVDADLDTQRLSDALANAAIALVRCRDEEEVQEVAAQLLHQNGFTCAFLVPEGADHLRQSTLRVHPEAEALAEKLTGKPLSQWRYPLSKLPHFRELLRTRRAAFIDDILMVVEKVHPPAVMEILRTYLPPARAIEAPVVVDGEVEAILSMQSPTLTPASVGTFELFVRCVGGAIENVRHHRRLAQHVDQLERLQGELLRKERLSALGDAAKVVSHEVRNPIGAIINAVSVLKKTTRGDGDGNGLLGMIEEEALRLDGIVRDLLELARPLDPRPIPVATDELSERVRAFVFGRDEGKRLDLSVSSDVEAVHADPPLILLALENLLRNAIQASPPGGRIEVTIRDRGERTLVAVEDEGPGIPAEDQHRLFEPFYTTRAKGTGLGLAVVKRVAEVHGAWLRVTRGALGGARFELEFPGPALAPAANERS